MNFVKKLKAKSIAGAVLIAALCLFLAAVFITAFDCLVLFQSPQTLYDVPREELEGAYVTVELPFIYDSYAYTEEFEDSSDLVGTVVAMEYIIDANYYDYCGLLVETDELIQKADLLLEQSIQYNYYELDEITASFTVTGVMTRMPADSLRFYHEVVGYDQMEEADQDIFLPLYLDVWDKVDTIQAVVFGILGLACLGMAVIVLVQAFTGHHQKQLLAKASQLSPAAPEQLLEQADQLLESDPKAKVLFNSRLLLVNFGNNSRLYALQELVWAYQSTVTRRIYFIPVGKSHSLVLATADGKRVQIPMKEAQVQEHLQALHQAHPQCFFGYNAEIDKMFRKDPAGLAAVLAAQVHNAQ